MRLYYGEKVVAKNEGNAKSENILHLSKKLLLTSNKPYNEIELGGKNTLFYWGKIFAIISKNGKYIRIDLGKNGKQKLKNFFKGKKIDEIVNKLEGDFIGCIIKNNKDVFLFSDSFNKKDVFYYKFRDGIIASNDLSFLKDIKIKSYDQAALANLLMIYGMYAPKKQTIYNDVKRLAVGEYLYFSKGKISLKKIKFKPLKVQTYDLKKHDEYYDILIESIKIRGSKKQNWLYLSSGWDSTTLLALLVEIYGKSKVKAIIGRMIFSEKAKNGNKFEIMRARKVAEYYDVDFSVVPLDHITNKGVKNWETIKPVLRNNHIYADNSCCFHYLSNYIRKNGSADDAVFCGEISDGAHNLGFAQFTTILEHPVYAFREYSDKMASYLFGPTFYKSILNDTYSNDAVYKLLRSRRGTQEFEDKNHLSVKEKKEKFLSSFFLRPDRFPFSSLKNIKYLTKNGRENFDSEMINTYLKECVKEITPDTIYSWFLHLYNTFHWQGSTVKSISTTTSFNNLHLNLPYWDKRLIEFLMKMPENWGRGLELRPTKYPIKFMLENKVDYPTHLQVGPHSYIYDVDPDFSLERELLYGSALVPYFKKILEDHPFEKILDKKYFNVSYFRKLADDYIAGIEANPSERANLYNLVWLCYIGWY